MDNDTATGREWAGLAVLALPTLLVSIDIFVLLLALPRLSQDLHASGTQRLWISDIYGFLLAGFLVTMGTLGDRTGRRRVLLTGAAAFGAASVLAAYSTSPAMLIAARALLGIAGAIGVWMACFMSGAAIGPIAGGLMLERRRPPRPTAPRPPTHPPPCSDWLPANSVSCMMEPWTRRRA
jgi:MFS transporter, DHA2 family, multidrug resistance protein